MKAEYKTVPAVEKCFQILDLFARSKRPMGISEIANCLNYHKSTVFNIVYTLTSLGILENGYRNKFTLGRQLYVLGKAAGKESELIHTVRPYLEELTEKTKLTAFLGILSKGRVVIVDKVDSPYGIRVSSEIGLSIPLLAGATGKVFLSQMSDDEVEGILSQKKMRRYTPFSCTNKKRFKEMIKEAREYRVAVDKEEYIEGIRAIAIPLRIGRGKLLASIWVVGLNSQLKDERIPGHSLFLRKIGAEIEAHFI
ncbi:MAG: IclR family transcriptional regulator [Desulfatiglandales bacterium]